MMAGMRAIAGLVWIAVACAAKPAAPERAPTAAPVRSTSAAASPSPNATTNGAASPSSEPPPAPAPPRTKTFPPADVPAPFARSAAAGDGHWKPFGDARTAGGAPFLVSTLIHPHEASKFITLALVAIDLGSTRLGFLPGVEDVGKLKVPFAPGLVPAAEQPRLLAVFNGGFMPQHGRWGMRVGETTILPPREPGCTVAILTSGAVLIRRWPELAATEAEIHALRQTPPCLVEKGALHPELLQNRDKAWAGRTPGIVTRRRSAIGLSADGQTLYYAIGVETPPKLLAEGLIAAGIHDAAQLDINWNWTRFFVFSKAPDGRLGVSEMLADVEHGKRDYVERASERDFFYVLRRE
jgi:hypothetical protein